MFRGARVLVVGAHPDDIEWGCFGTLLKLPPSLLVCYVMSSGGLGDRTSGSVREKEASEALKMLNPKYVVVDPEVGLNPLEYHNYVSRVEGLAEAYEPHLVIAPTKHDTHQDHRLAHDIVVTAMRRYKVSLIFYDPYCHVNTFDPNLFVDISKYMDANITAVTSHKTQEGKTYMMEEFIRDYHKRYVGLFGKSYIEAFEVDRIWISS
jgi:LmbE family N-acetylglucosaminyl deacetylase